VYRLVPNLLDIQNLPVSKVVDIMRDAARRQAYEGRIKYDRPEYEKAIFEAFSVGKAYTLDDIKQKVIKALKADWSVDLRIRKGSYVQLMNRYFETKYSRSRKEHKIVCKINLIRTESSSDL